MLVLMDTDAQTNLVTSSLSILDFDCLLTVIHSFVMSI